MRTVRTLTANDLPQVLDHFTALGPDGRLARFGATRSLAGVRDYVERMRWDQDEVFGVTDADGQHLVGLAHLPRTPDGDVELGLSVVPVAQRQGLGRLLLQEARRRALRWGVRAVRLHYQRDNPALLHLVRDVGGRVQHDANDALLTLPLTAQNAGPSDDGSVRHPELGNAPAVA